MSSRACVPSYLYLSNLTTVREEHTPFRHLFDAPDPRVVRQMHAGEWLKPATGLPPRTGRLRLMIRPCLMSQLVRQYLEPGLELSRTIGPFHCRLWRMFWEVSFRARRPRSTEALMKFLRRCSDRVHMLHVIVKGLESEVQSISTCCWSWRLAMVRY